MRTNKRSSFVAELNDLKTLVGFTWRECIVDLNINIYMANKTGKTYHRWDFISSESSMVNRDQKYPLN